MVTQAKENTHELLGIDLVKSQSMFAVAFPALLAPKSQLILLYQGPRSFSETRLSFATG